MTEETAMKIHQKLADEAFAIHQEILGMEKNIELGFWYIGERLYKIKNDELYRQLGFNSFPEYLAQPEIKSSRIAYQLLAVYRRYVIELKCEPKQLTDIGYSKLDLIKDHVDSKNLDDMIHKAQTLSRRQLEDEYRVDKKGNQGKSLVDKIVDGYIHLSYEQRLEFHHRIDKIRTDKAGDISTEEDEEYYNEEYVLSLLKIDVAELSRQRQEFGLPFLINDKGKLVYPKVEFEKWVVKKYGN